MGHYPAPLLTSRLESYREPANQEKHQHQADQAAGGPAATNAHTAEYQG